MKTILTIDFDIILENIDRDPCLALYINYKDIDSLLAKVKQVYLSLKSTLLNV